MSIDTFFTAIKNRKWHSIDELSNQLAISPVKLKELSTFLSERGLVKYDKKDQRIKIQSIWALLLPTQEEQKTQKNILANFIIPPHASIDIHSTQISNISNVEIELTLRIDTKISEISIAV